MCVSLFVIVCTRVGACVCGLGLPCVCDACCDVQGGVGGHYDQLVIQLRTAKDPTALANLYTALTHNVAHLGAAPSKFSTLLDAGTWHATM